MNESTGMMNFGIAEAFLMEEWKAADRRGELELKPGD